MRLPVVSSLLAATAFALVAARARAQIPAGTEPLLLLVGEQVVELRASRVVGRVDPPESALATDGQGIVYRLERDGRLSAFAAAALVGPPRWAVQIAPGCQSLVASPGRVLCRAGTGVTAYAATDGRSAVVAGQGAAGSEPVDLAVSGDVAMVLYASGEHRVVDMARGATLATVPAPSRPTIVDPSRARAVSLPAAGPGGALCALTALSGDLARPGGNLHLACHDGRTGALRFTHDLAWNRVTRHGNANVYQEVATLLSEGRAHLLFGPPPFREVEADSIALSGFDGREVAVLHRATSALLERDDGSLEGLLAVKVNATQGLDLVLFGPASNPTAPWAERWRLRDGAMGDVVETVNLPGGVIAVASHSPNALGATLWALDRATGAVRWNRNPGFIVAAHSRYSNHVELVRSGSMLALLGRESGGTYAQVVDIATGTRQLAVLPPHCATDPVSCSGW